MAAVALFGISSTLWSGGASVPALRPATQLDLQPPRRAVLGFGALALGAAAAPPLPARAIFGLFEPQMVPYTMLDAFNISFPQDFAVLKNDSDFMVWQGDKIQPSEQMSASAKVVPFDNLAAVLGSNFTEVGERLGAKRRAGQATVVENITNVIEGLDSWQFEFLSDRLHEYALFAIVKRGSDNVLCSVTLRTASLLWESRKDTFKQIIGTFKALEPQPPRSPASAAPLAQPEAATAEAATAAHKAPAGQPELASAVAAG